MFIHFHRNPRDQWTNFMCFLHVMLCSVMLNKESIKEDLQNASTLDLKVEAKLP